VFSRENARQHVVMARCSPESPGLFFAQSKKAGLEAALASTPGLISVAVAAVEGVQRIKLIDQVPSVT
jgi:hypothetical protein